VVYVKDASVNTAVVANLLNEKLKTDYLSSIEDEYQKIREKQAPKVELLSLEEAKRRKPKLF
jgi:5-methyltetrahydrofolate--homocysteine methyltransferase